MNDRHRETYREEAYELLTELERALLELEESPEDQEIIGQVFRTMHTIKGSGAMFGFDDIASFTHEIESCFDHVRSGTLPVTKELIDLTLKARDCILAMLDSSSTGASVDLQLIEETVVAFRRLSSKESKECDTPDPSAPGNICSTDSPGTNTYRVRFRPNEQIFATGTNPLPLLNELRELGTCRIVAQLEALPPLATLKPELCHTYWDIVLTTDRGVNAIKDVFIFVEDESEISIDVIHEEGEVDEAQHKRLGEILVQRGDLSGQELRRVLAEKRPIGELLVDAGLVTPDKVQAALAEQEQLRDVREKQKKEESLASIRVAAEKLDRLVDLVGELVTVQARLTQKAGSQHDPELLLIAEAVEHLTNELRDNTMSIRMLPIGTTFGRFRRLVRDLSAELGKEIELIAEGAETELDKTVIERLNDPLVHIIRNSIDHGIEEPAIRMACGKPRKGTIHLSALYGGASVLITIKDDGFGLDVEAIRGKAIEKGLIPPNADLSEKETYSLIFAPGFSTAKTVTSVSGRGVGMDVVRKTIEALRGSIDVESVHGKGTTITLTLPLTLAIIDGLLVEVGGQRFVMPLSLVEECIELVHLGEEAGNGHRLVNLRGQLVPYIRLRETFGIKGALPAIEQIVITRTDSQKIGFAVDAVIGEHQTVIKSLSRVYRGVDGVSGATILGDGTVALIMDVARLAAGAHGDQTTQMQARV
jgi:two-component system chemotaxis sensor kinase CheA